MLNSCGDAEPRRASDVLYDELILSRNSIRRENARRIKKVCDQMEKDRVTIMAAEVVRRCGDAGPAYSTVSNKGSKLGAYISLRMTEQGAGRPSQDPRKSIADNVADPVIQAQIRDKEATAKFLARENSGLRNLLKNLRPGIEIDDILREANKTPGVAALPKIESNALDPEVGSAILKMCAHLIGARNYAELGGRLTINGKIVLDPSEYSALRRATGLSVEEWKTRFSGASGAGSGF